MKVRLLQKKVAGVQQRRISNGKKVPSLVLALTLFVFGILVVTVLLIGLVAGALIHFDLVSFRGEGHGGLLSGLLMLLTFSVVIGTSLVAMLGHVPLRPIRKLKRAMREVASGNFAIRVSPCPVPELNELIDDFNTMAEELGSVEALRKDFINNFSHEFRTPIVSIKGFAKLLRTGTLNASEQAEYLDIIIDESDRLVQLSSTVLALSRLENQSTMTGQTTFLLDEQIRRCILLLESQWHNKQLQFDVELEPVECFANDELLRQVWLNLIGNAIKFTPPGGQIQIRNTQSGIVTISDTGIGMDEQTRARIFEKFYQGDTTHAVKGNGLGLALVKRILDLCGARIEVNSEPGKGSSFTVLLPETILHSALDQNPDLNEAW
jgi:signal transduction histidine kinase